MIDFSKLPRRYQLTFHGEHVGEISFHKTREQAMKKAYDRLDLAQRDALAMGDQAKADGFGRERHLMASKWKETVTMRSLGRFVTDHVVIVSQRKGKDY
jgi:hypothetical protein